MAILEKALMIIGGIVLMFFLIATTTPELLDVILKW